ncbi:hypothetical protein G9A89_010724 [Geosiphon pyriformis]|nr:hypothetical protein G9A89_010724 [Geosiphon pyriformis]
MNSFQDEIPVAKLVYSFDWSATQLGAMDTWPSSLKTIVDLCLNSVFPMAIYYGPDKILIYNQSWRPIIKMKHPALGKPASEVWAEVWDRIGPIFEDVVSTGKGKYNDNLMFYIKRAGYSEEAYFSFTFSPIFTMDKTVGGILAVVQETTARVLSTRRLKTLSDLGKRTPGAKSAESACHSVATVLRDNADLTYALMYLLENDAINKPTKGYVARLTTTTFDTNLHIVLGEDGVEELRFVEGQSKRCLPDHLLKTPDFIDVTDGMNDFIKDFDKSKNHGINQNSQIPIPAPKSTQSIDGVWPIKEVVRTNQYQVTTLPDQSQAILLPVSTSFSGKTMLTAILICGINKYQTLDAKYLEFCKLVVGHVSSGLKNARSREEERKQTELLADLNRQRLMFFQNMSQELRTPLTLILAPLEDAISICEPNSPILRNLEMAQRNTKRLSKLVSTLLQFSRIEAGHLEAHYSETQIAKLTRELAANFEGMAKSFGLELHLDIPEDKILEAQLQRKVYLDSELYEKILLNLCSNAFKYTWHGNITVRLYPDKRECGEVVVLEVSDTGVGIAKEHLEKLFQRFYRVESQQSRTHEGTGIGLAFVKELITLHGGDIKVTSQINVGTKFQVWIPTGYDHLPQKNVLIKIRGGEHAESNSVTVLSKNKPFNDVDLYLEETKQWIVSKPQTYSFPINYRDDEVAKITMENLKSLSIKEDPSPFLHPAELRNDPNRLFRVLLIDDNTDMRNYLREILQKEFEVISACDGFDAIRVIRTNREKPDLILSDIMMPRMNGFELLEAIRSDTSTRFIPVIFLSARAGEEANVEGLDKGADDYLIKPFSARELIARVRVNIRLSKLRQELDFQEYRENQMTKLLFSIGSKIRSGLGIQEILLKAVTEIRRTFTCDSLLILSRDSMNKGIAEIIAASSSYPEINALVGTQVPCRGIDESQEIWLDELHESPDFGSSAHATFSSCDQTFPVISNLIPPLNEANTRSNFPDFEIENNTHYFSKILTQPVSSISVTIPLKSSFWGIIAYRKPDEIWLDTEKIFLQRVSNQISLAITHSKLSEEKLKREAQMEAAKAANEAKGQILANTSHELRTPLGAIIGVLSAFEDTTLSPDQKDMVQIMTRASDVVLSVVNDILDAAKLEAQKITLTNRNFDLFELVEKTIEIFGEKAGSKKIELVLFFEPNELPQKVNSDPKRLRQILINLLSNSVKFTESGQILLKISLVSYSEELKQTESDKGPNLVKFGNLLFELTDTGMGIDPAFMKDIWESFSQGDPSMTRRQDGTGLGLSICKHLVTLNGGDLGAQSELGKGSRFWFTWNVGVAALPNPLTTTSKFPFAETIFAIPDTIKSKRVIIVDSIEASRSAILAMLSPFIEKVDTFDDCSKALIAAKALNEIYCDLPFDIIFFNLNERNADQIVRMAIELRSLYGNSKLAIGLFVFWSAGDRALGKEIMQKIGDNTAVLCKPITFRRLFDCFNSKEFFNSAKMDEPKAPVGLSISRFRSDYDHQNTIDSSSCPESTIIKENPTNLGLPCKRSASHGSNVLTQPIKSRKLSVSPSKCILCVEDNPINLKVIQHQLTKLGYKSLTATNGQEAVKLIEDYCTNSVESDGLANHNKISLILMDCAMPIMSGFDASKAIRGIKHPQAEVPIIALTASAVEGTRDKCLESGMNDYLTKPLKLLQLKEKLFQWLDDS